MKRCLKCGNYSRSKRFDFPPEDLPCTLILDIDGTLVKHCGSLIRQVTEDLELLPGVLEKMLEWEKAGHRLILLTGRRECYRQRTEEQLRNLGIPFDLLLMGATRGARIIINDMKPGTDYPTAQCRSLERNEGLENVYI